MLWLRYEPTEHDTPTVPELSPPHPRTVEPWSAIQLFGRLGLVSFIRGAGTGDWGRPVKDLYVHRKGTKLSKCTAAAARFQSTATATCGFLLPAMNGPTTWLKLEAAAPNLRVLATGRTAAASPAGSRGVSGLTAELEATARRAVARPLQSSDPAALPWAKFSFHPAPQAGSPICVAR